MSAEQTMMIDSLDDFVRVLLHWHQNKVGLLMHMMSIPPGTEVSDSETPNEPPLVLQGDALKGFQLGLKTALHEMGSLPFEAELEIVPEGSEAGSSSQAELPLSH